jgi:hypothetical protein
VDVFPLDLEPLEDVSAASWVETDLATWPRGRFRVSDLVPGRFAAYARVLHSISGHGSEESVTTWATTARARGVELHPETSSLDLFGGQPNAEETLNERELSALVPVLRRHTTTQETCWFCVWDGYADLLPHASGTYLMEGRTPPLARWRDRWVEKKEARHARRIFRRFRRVAILRHERSDPPGRSYLLFAGPVELAGRVRRSLSHSPNLWWPEDRAWFVHTEIDGYDTYVVGPRSLVDELTASTSLECFEVTADSLAAG